MHWYEGTKAAELAKSVLNASELESLEEIRLRVNRPAVAAGAGWQKELDCVFTAKDSGEYLKKLSGHALYAAQTNMEQGFFTIEGGCRVGFCGVAAGKSNFKVTRPMYFSIRIPREIRTAAKDIMSYMIKDGRALSAIILSAPGGGKTTLLRDMARRLSDGIGCRRHRVAVADERGEICGCEGGVPTMDLGGFTDVMDGGAKAVSMELLIRNMSPQVIVADELGASDDEKAVRDALRCGVKVIVSAHAENLEEAKKRRPLKQLFEEAAFDRYVILKNKKTVCITDGRFEPIFGGKDENNFDDNGVSLLYGGRSKKRSEAL